MANGVYCICGIIWQFGKFVFICQIKCTQKLIIREYCSSKNEDAVEQAHGIVYKYFPRVSKEGDNKKPLHMPEEIKKVDELVTKVLVSSKSRSRGKHNFYTAQLRAQVGKYAAEHGPTKAAVHFSPLWKSSINESTARQLQLEYLRCFA